MKIIILAGGGGTRLFPLSRSCYPKQFLKIAGQESLLIQTVKRYLKIADQDNIVIVTNKNYIFHVREELNHINAEGVHVITETVGRNTAPAIVLAMSFCKEKLQCADDEIFFVSPADHLLKPDTILGKVIEDNICTARAGYIITFGIYPLKPVTSYGYIQTTDKKVENAFKVSCFKEKPDIDTAKKYIKAGNYYWNSGMFMFTYSAMAKEVETYVPEIANLFKQGYSLMQQHFSELPNISIDYAVAEKSKIMVVVPLNGIYWNDVGSFDALAELLAHENGNAFYGDIVTEGCSNTLILGAKRLITGIGLKDIMIIDTPDALLVSKKGESEKVKNIVAQLKANNRCEAIENLTTYRPWGHYTVLCEGEGYKVKQVIIKPGKKISLQKHHHRSEHWTVIKGTGKLTLEGKVIIFRENESAYIPIGALHRLENPGKIPLVIIEVQNGQYLGEDDIQRFEDDYGRDVD